MSIKPEDEFEHRITERESTPGTGIMENESLPEGYKLRVINFQKYSAAMYGFKDCTIIIIPHSRNGGDPSIFVDGEEVPSVNPSEGMHKGERWVNGAVHRAFRKRQSFDSDRPLKFYLDREITGYLHNGVLPEGITWTHIEVELALRPWIEEKMDANVLLKFRQLIECKVNGRLEDEIIPGDNTIPEDADYRRKPSDSSE